VLLKDLRKYLSIVLLVAFAWVITPTHTIHDLFADHEDTADNFCLTHHAHLGTHVEELHTHCDILDVNTPVYYTPTLVTLPQLVSIVQTKYNFTCLNRIISFSVCNLPSRAPPVVA
jgi:hypothetical protein